MIPQTEVESKLKKASKILWVALLASVTTNALLAAIASFFLSREGYWPEMFALCFLAIYAAQMAIGFRNLFALAFRSAVGARSIRLNFLYLFRKHQMPDDYSLPITSAEAYFAAVAKFPDASDKQKRLASECLGFIEGARAVGGLSAAPTIYLLNQAVVKYLMNDKD